jgi:hypothetical protein
MAAAYYEILEAEADVVHMVYERYTVQGMSIGAITRLLNEQGVPTRKLRSRWERSTVWGMLRNPAYKGAPASAEPGPPRASGSRGRCGCAAALPHATAQTMSARAITGSRSRCPPSSTMRRSRSPRSCSRPTRSTHRGAQRRAGPGVLQQVRLCPLPHLDQVEHTEDPPAPRPPAVPLVDAWRPGQEAKLEGDPGVHPPAKEAGHHKGARDLPLVAQESSATTVPGCLFSRSRKRRHFGDDLGCVSGGAKIPDL